MSKYLIVGLLLLLTCINAGAQENSALAEGDWYKVSVDKAGVYRINQSFMADLGIDINAIDPENIQIYGNSGGMLPQPNSAERPTDLVQNAIYIEGESDGSFDGEDYILFYADGPDSYTYDAAGTLNYEQNLYDRKNYYFIKIANSPGQRISDLENSGNAFPKVTTFNDFQHHELSLTNLLISGRKWYGEKFDINTSYSVSIDVPGIIQNSAVKVTSKVMAQSFAPSSLDLTLNGTSLGTQNLESVPDYNNAFSRYAIKGKEDNGLFTINTNQISSPQNLELTFTYNKNNSGRSVAYLDRATIEFLRKLKWYGTTTIFRSLESLNNVQTTFEISDVDNSIVIWDITDKQSPANQKYSSQSSKLTFGAPSSSLKEYALFKPANLPSPVFIKKINNQNLHGLASTDLLIITHDNFKTEAQRLASFRSSYDKLSTTVVTTEQIFNEFSSGRQDVTALRDFVKHIYDKGSKLKYLLLFGRGSYDYLDILPNNTNYVPIYESRNSLHPLDTYGSDDYYGFLEEAEGEWEEVENSTTHTLDIGIGRLPVSSIDQAREVVDKLINYSTNEKNYGSWRNVMLFVADDEDQNLHHRQADQLSKMVDTTYKAINTRKLYLDAYKQISNPNGERSPEASVAIDEAVEKGSMVVNYTGHGGETGWMQEQVLDLIMINNWDNNNKLPLFVTATCEFSRHDDPRRVSGGELVVTNPDGGGIGIVSTCRPVQSSSNFELNKAFYNAIFQSQTNQNLRLGDIIRLTKNDVNKIGNRNFALLGDPSLRLSFPQKNITISSIQNQGVDSDTLNALSQIKISGEISNKNNAKDASFNGTLHAIVYDKESLFTTLGNGNSPFNYYVKENVIFRGTASVTNGNYEFNFVVPKNISYQFEEGKISLYAVKEDNSIDARGAQDVITGGSNNSPSTDDQGPEISIYLGDSSNNSYVDIASNTNLIANISDESGINISGYGVGNNLIAILDDSLEFELNEFYEASLDTYKEGWVNFPLNNLTKGSHRLRIKAWDTFNNSSEKEISFTVLDPNRLNISQLFNYPNPFNESTTFSFQHNRAGEDLEIELDILSLRGELIQKFKFSIEESTSNINLANWDGSNTDGEKLKSGLYLFKLTVRSTKDGAAQEQQQKLILIN